MITKSSSAKELYILPSFFEKIGITTTSSSEFSSIKSTYQDNIMCQFKKIRFIPISGGTLDFESDIWDLNTYTIINKPEHILHFDSLYISYRNLLKSLLLFIILSKNIKISSLVSTFKELRAFLNFLANQCSVFDINDISAKNVKAFLDAKSSCKTMTLIKYQHSIKSLLVYYDSEYKTNIYTEQIASLCKRPPFRKLKAEAIENRRSPIPAKYRDTLISLLIKGMNDETKSNSLRAQYAILIIASQTGLRASELSLLEIDSAENIIVDGKEYSLLNYKMIKTAKNDTGYLNEKTFLNPVAKEAYEQLTILHAENRKARNSKLLYCPLRRKLPVNQDVYIDYLKRFVCEHADVLDAFNDTYKDSLSSTTVGSMCRGLFKHKIEQTVFRNYSGITENTMIYYPIVHQFRNTVVSELFRHGTKLEYIRRYMGHLTTEMTASYAGFNDNDIQENQRVAEEVIKTYVTGEAKILGTSGERIMQSIDEFLLKNNLNVATDLDEIILRLTRLIPIRAKHGGVCMKGTVLRDACDIDAKVDEMFCAYGVCPNVCHFYFMADVSYSDFKAAVDVYNYNVQNGFKRQAEKEKNKIRFIIKNRLLDEMTALKDEINLKGVQHILYMYPQLKEVINNYDLIMNEIKQWEVC